MDLDVSPLPCADKLVFETPEAAQATGTVNKWRYGTQLKVYHCRHCQLYHLATRYNGSHE